MTPAEMHAYNEGVRAVLAHARRAAAALAANTKRPLAIGFAVTALEALADEGAALMLPLAAEPKGFSHVG